MKDDLISRNAAIEVIDAVFPVDPMRSEYAQGIASGAALAKTYVSQLPSAQQWIPCSERLPDNDFTDVLICVHDKRKGCEKDYYIISAYTSGRHWEPTLNVDMTDFDVVAWMPLPSPYREEVSD